MKFTDMEKTSRASEIISEYNKCLGFNAAQYWPWAYHDWSGGKFKYRFEYGKLTLKVEYDGDKRFHLGFVPDILEHIPLEISELFLYVLDLC